jgi:hypothetical protein
MFSGNCSLTRNIKIESQLRLCGAWVSMELGLGCLGLHGICVSIINLVDYEVSWSKFNEVEKLGLTSRRQIGHFATIKTEKRTVRSEGQGKKHKREGTDRK